MDAPKGVGPKREREHRAASARARRDVFAVAVVYAGTIAIVFALVAADAEALPAPARMLLENAPMLLVGALAVRLLGAGALRGTLAARPLGRDLLLALPAAALMLAAGLAWVRLAAALSDEPFGIGLGVPSAGLLLEMAVLPALVEEWLCRGVLWTACGRLTTRAGTIAATALLFALLHAPGRGLLGVPDAAVAGVILGVLRARTGSLVPCVLAHFLNHAVAAAGMAA